MTEKRWCVVIPFDKKLDAQEVLEQVKKLANYDGLVKPIGLTIEELLRVQQRQFPFEELR